ncbi:MAG: hypothetical protein ACRDDY_04310 [Clostridium sp.]|uniref:hypothetical protein n=1 Tax=Clostridium sp. TaxID=1506 RepID=UPI003EE5DCAD
MIRLYDDLRTDSCCKNMDKFSDYLFASIKVLSHTIALNKVLGIYTEKYIQELCTELERLKEVYGRIFDRGDLEDALKEE